MTYSHRYEIPRGSYRYSDRTDPWGDDKPKSLSARLVGWLLTGFVIIALAVCFPVARELFRAGNTDYSRVPTMERSAYIARLDQLDHELNVVGSTPDAYFQTVLHLRSDELVLEKARELAVYDGRMLAGRYGLADGGQARLSQLQERYQTRFGIDGMAGAAQRFNSNPQWVHAVQGQSAPNKHIRWPLLLQYFRAAWFWSALSMFGFFVVRLKQQGLKVLPEPVRLVFWSTFWLVGVWRYPHNINPVKQAVEAYRLVRRVLGGLMATSISLAGAAVAHAGETRPNTGEVLEQQGNVMVLSVADMPRAPDFTVVASTSVKSQKVTSNGIAVAGPTATWDVSTTFRNGWNIDLSGTNELSGSGGSDEVDYCVSRSGPHLSGGVCYYDILPLGTGRGGDMISPFVEVSGPLGHGWTGSVKAEGNILTGGPPGNNSYLVTAAASRSDTLAPNVQFDQTLSAAYGEGPFHQDAGLIARWRGKFSSALNQHIRVDWFSFDLFAPVLGARDRYPTGSASIGVHYAF